MVDAKIAAIIMLGFTVLMYALGGIESKYACQAEKQQIQMLLEQKGLNDESK